MKILVLHGVNLNMFGKREKTFYGSATLREINEAIALLANRINIHVVFFQTNDEKEFIERIHAVIDEDIQGLLINAGAWTHYSYALADALAILAIPIVEVHMSNIFARDKFRHNSVISPLAKGVICGFGVESYLLGLRALVNFLKNSNFKENISV